MITASIGSHRFESGPTYHYNSSNTDELVEALRNPEPTVEYVNMLPGVDASPGEIQQVAAAGVVRLAIAGPEPGIVPEATEVLLDVCRGDIGAIPEDIFVDPRSWDGDSRISGRLSNATFDSASVLATRKNNAAETAGIIGAEVPVDEGVLVIGIANGGIVSAAHTFLRLGGDDHELTFIRYSRHKCDHKEPMMHPYPELRKDLLRRSSEDRHIVVYDEDYTTGATLYTAVEYFAEFFEREVIGIAPVEVERRVTYKPLLIKPQ